jgi:pimeloyl-ACP methyl ester carboxylesterase
MERFWRTLPGTVLLVLILAIVTAAGALTLQVHRATHPPRETDEPRDLGALLSQVEEVRFRSADGIELDGWLLRGEAGRAAVVLCHDLGASKGSLVNLAIALQKSGFTVLGFDFRGHGKSGGEGSTLGITEKRDVLGAIDYLVSLKEIETRRIGIYGVGLGAHAAVLAALDRPAAKVLVLDGLYPDVGYPLKRKVYAGWEFGVRRLGFFPRLVFRLTSQSPLENESASAVLPRLEGRDLLFVAPAGDSLLAAEMQRLYASVPEQRDAEANLITLPATRATHLYGEELDRYNGRITEFFAKRLARR